MLLRPNSRVAKEKGGQEIVLEKHRWNMAHLLGTGTFFIYLFAVNGAPWCYSMAVLTRHSAVALTYKNEIAKHSYFGRYLF